MRVAVVAPQAVPFAVGGAERLCDGLVEQIGRRPDVTCELVKRDSPEYSFRQLLDSYQTFAELDLSGFDHIISTKYPSWMVRHPSHHVYLLHPLRGLYDAYHGFDRPLTVDPAAPALITPLLDALAQPFGTADGWRTVLGTAREAIDTLRDDDPVFVFPGALIRRVVHWLDRDAMDPVNVRRYCAISRTVAEREDYFPIGAEVSVLLPPTNLAGQLHAGPQQAFFTASRLDGAKRIDLLIDAMAQVPGSVQLRIAGSGPSEQHLRSLRPDDERIVFLGRLSEADLVTEYANAIAVPFVPFDEDFGLVGLEAQLAGKAVITCTDSGGVTELVLDKVSGRIVAPDAGALGQVLSEFVTSPNLAELMGAQGRMRALDVTWDLVVDTLLPGPVPVPDPTRRDRPADRRLLGRLSAASRAGVTERDGRATLLVLSTYPAYPVQHGGQIRLNRLLRGLAEQFDVELVALSHNGQGGVSRPYPGLRQTVVVSSEEHQRLEAQLSERSPIPIGDIAASLFVQHSPKFLEAVRAVGARAVGAVLEQPYLLPALLRACPGLPFAYDSQNAEAEMKSAMLVGAPHGAELAAVVQTVERHAVRQAELIGACSSQDRERLTRLGPTLAEWALVPNGADVFDTPFVVGEQRAANRRRWIERLQQRRPSVRARNLALFVGSYHPPNLDAARVIIELADQLPEVCFVLAGRLGVYFQDWITPPNVLTTGQVSDAELRILLASADVALNPMTSGGGTNLKLIEYFAAGVPVVSTALGTRGVDVTPGVELLVSEVADFPAAIAEVLANADQANRRAQHARKLAEASYDWLPISRAYADRMAAAFGSARSEPALPID